MYNPPLGTQSMLRRGRVVVVWAHLWVCSSCHICLFTCNTEHDTNAIACHSVGILQQFPHKRFYKLSRQNMLIKDLKIITVASSAFCAGNNSSFAFKGTLKKICWKQLSVGYFELKLHINTPGTTETFFTYCKKGHYTTPLIKLYMLNYTAYFFGQNIFITINIFDNLFSFRSFCYCSH